MTFNSIEFLLFYPTVAFLYFLLPKKAKWPMLLVASYFFYMCYQAELVFLIFGTTLVSFVASKIIEKTEKKTVKKLCLGITLAVCLGVLFFYKYFNFLSGSVTGLFELFGKEATPFEIKLVLPVGISFYTFQTLSYVIDVYRGDIESEKNFFFYALFVSFFPQLVAGPIERPGNLIPQLREYHEPKAENFLKGSKHIILGFFKKICVADLISVYVNSVYNNVEESTSFGIIIATVLFAVQILCDFSGYTDIAIGCARIMGIRLMQNFDRPYSATSIKEFWSRWHISLSSWFRDYLYIPLGGNRCGKFRHFINIMIVFLVSGLWHGANWTFVIWGAIHGVYQIVGTLTLNFRNALLDKIGLSHESFAVMTVRRVNTFILTCFAWLFFRANSLRDAMTLLQRLFGEWCSPSLTFEAMGMTLVGALMTVFSVLTLIMLDRMVRYDDLPDGSSVLTKNSSFILFIWIIMFAWVLLLSRDMLSTFIYFQF